MFPNSKKFRNFWLLHRYIKDNLFPNFNGYLNVFEINKYRKNRFRILTCTSIRGRQTNQHTFIWRSQALGTKIKKDMASSLNLNMKNEVEKMLDH